LVTEILKGHNRTRKRVLVNGKMMDIGKEKLIWMYTKRREIRLFGERIADLYRWGLFPSLAYVYVGQRAVATCVCICVREDDYLLGVHRGHAHNIARGVPIDKLAVEIPAKP